MYCIKYIHTPDIMLRKHRGYFYQHTLYISKNRPSNLLDIQEKNIYITDRAGQLNLL